MEQRKSEKQLVHKNENQTFIFSLIVSIIVYGLMLSNVISFIYLLFILVGLTITNGIMNARIRLNGVRISAKQMPEVYQKVEELCNVMEIKKIPEVYVIESGGLLNAFATKFSGKNMIVLYSEILDLIDTEEKDVLSFVIAHELAHIKRNHMVKQMLILPAMIIPTLGKAYSRCCEYTCDLMAASYTNNMEAALNGLTILAVGKKLFKKVNRSEYLEQSNMEKGFFVMLAERTSTHPSLPKRIEEIQRYFIPSSTSTKAKSKTAIIILATAASFIIIVAGIGYLFAEDIVESITSITESDSFDITLDDDVMDMIDAVAAGDEKRVKELLEVGVDPNGTDVDGWTPLMWAAQNSDIQMIQLLIDAGADLDITNSYDETALDFAIYQDNKNTINVLIQSGADPNLTDSTGWTPLMTAVSNECVEAVKALLEAGADPDRKDDNQFTAYLYAVKNNNKEIADLLK